MQKILIADDHEVMRHGLVQILQEEYPLAQIEEASNGLELVSLAKKADWTFIITDISMPLLNGLDALTQIRKFLPDIPILVLSMHSDEHYCSAAFKAGASGYVTKSMAQNELIKAVNKIMSGKMYIPEALVIKNHSQVRNSPT
ncbi:MAG: response regulator transcription factor [Bacteroidetes bacterium]|jgi:two-component system, NarL family, invasion response regulator UvrY|nr:response regulator transcription factor [Bacteroidota bacterium]